ncbi:MAG: hypothetical protein M5U34_10850 [Chloroflexi bacterium]|nr:hypothetical protein [Chloroflexota bacterium]
MMTVSRCFDMVGEDDFMTMTQNWPDSQTFWQDKRVIVTGGAGFLGSFVVDKLQGRGRRRLCRRARRRMI